ncbi:hypothetical protein Nepgr_028854 [Nepenthes gracilis]|uniref:Uncharacterized protein n=1 Tax=Nepenthes gracilis TaxID=150966 RepID=A0AAD3TDA6_NEPGR|nr:hypothetical protein Nepgr_028854 [Nepenthes gracilis]
MTTLVATVAKPAAYTSVGVQGPFQLAAAAAHTCALAGWMANAATSPVQAAVAPDQPLLQIKLSSLVRSGLWASGALNPESSPSIDNVSSFKSYVTVCPYALLHLAFKDWEPIEN